MNFKKNQRCSTKTSKWVAVAESFVKIFRDLLEGPVFKKSAKWFSDLQKNFQKR